MVITDIEMPGRNGLELLSYIRARWKRCRVIILTAFSLFQYAYSALQFGVDGYILKSESNEAIRDKLAETLHSIGADMRESAYYAEKKMQHVLAVRKNGLIDLLNRPWEPAQQQEQLVKMGFSESPKKLFLIVCRHSQPDGHLINETILHELLGHYLRDSIFCLELARPNNSELVWLLELSETTSHQDANRISGILEMVQTACQEMLALPLSFTFTACHGYTALLHNAYGLICSTFSKMAKINQPFIYNLSNIQSEATLSQNMPDSTIAWLCKHIDENISSDLSLINLAVLSGYNPQYLSSLFKQKYGVTLSQYISDKRMNIARDMLSDAEIPIQEVATHLGFASHSYFSRFIRKATGLTPQQFRSKLTGIPESEE